MRAPVHPVRELAVAASCCALLTLACGRQGEARGAVEDVASRASSPAAPAVREPGDPSEIFHDATAESGLDFVHFNGMSGELYFCEMVGPGAALFDADGDGDLDLYLVQGHMLGAGKTLADATFAPRHPRLVDRLYRNDLEPGGARFVDVTAASGLEPRTGYGMGVAAGDYDNDGRVDLYVTALGPNQLLRNLGPGADGGVRFADVTAETGTDDRRWSVSATFVDVDRDGWLDLYVGNYVAFTLARHKRCRAASGAPDYCGPQSYPDEPDRLFRNAGPGADGRVTFEDVTRRAGLDAELGGALGVVAADFDLDGWMDLYVANDGVANQMWINQGATAGGAIGFRNEALLAGSALNREGRPEAGMGVDAGDVDNDGDEDIFLSHLTQETNTLYVNSGDAQFTDATVPSGLGTPSWEATGFGTGFFDVDNDGWLDLLVLNGAVRHIEALARAGDPYPLHQPNQLFRNLGDGRFADVTADAGAAFAPSEVSRGAAFGDVDNDGDADVVVANNNGPARLLLNRLGDRGHWLGLRLLESDGRRDALGAWVEIARPDAPSLWRRASAGGSYASARDPRVLVGLGTDPEVTAARVRWPSGARESFEIAAVDRYLTLREGAGDPLP